MDMVAKFQDQVTFHLTGALDGATLQPVAGAGLRPAALAGLHDLTRLRYDYPLVLADLAHGGEAMPLSTVLDLMLTTLAPRGIEGERLRREVLRVERELRCLLASGEHGRLLDLWHRAVERVVDEATSNGRAEAGMAEVLVHAGEALKLDGALVDCTPQLPAQLLAHAWHTATARKAERFMAMTGRLSRTLTDILRAARARSAEGQTPEGLQAAFGSGQADAFDFTAMSRLVQRSATPYELPATRRNRIERTLAALRWQPFYADDAVVMNYSFASCDAALAAYRKRLPQLVETVKAIAIAELECEGRYIEAEHDPFFARFAAAMITPTDLALFPDYLVRIPPLQNSAADNAGLLNLLSGALPVKVLVQVDDVVDDNAIGAAAFAFGVRPARLATTAMGLGGMYVLQAAASAMAALKRQVERGMECSGPALFCIYAGLPADRGTLPAYLSAALAMDARVFPAFTYDAAAGPNWSTRFALHYNRESQADWVRERIGYADDKLQRAAETQAVTLADFALADAQLARHFALVPRERCNAAMLPVADWLTLDERDASARIPYVLAVDPQARLQRVIVDAALMQAVRRTLLLWHRLQEHAGINDSHAQRQLADQQAQFKVQAQMAAAAAAAAAASTTATATAPSTKTTAAAAPEPAPAPSLSEAPPSDVAWIETARCPSCNECQTINPRMFTYNANQQAYIKDINAGTYRQLVEAAESCQVAIIHPGKPRDPNEPGLDELIERARPFL
jgi:ferredoxin